MYIALRVTFKSPSAISFSRVTHINPHAPFCCSARVRTGCFRREMHTGVIQSACFLLLDKYAKDYIMWAYWGCWIVYWVGFCGRMTCSVNLHLVHCLSNQQALRSKGNVPTPMTIGVKVMGKFAKILNYPFSKSPLSVDKVIFS